MILLFSSYRLAEAHVGQGGEGGVVKTGIQVPLPLVLHPFRAPVLPQYLLEAHLALFGLTLAVG